MNKKLSLTTFKLTCFNQSHSQIIEKKINNHFSNVCLISEYLISISKSLPQSSKIFVNSSKSNKFKETEINQNTSVTCHGNLHTNRICIFENLYFSTVIKEFLFFHGSNSKVINVPINRFDPTLLELSSIYDHNSENFNYIDIRSELFLNQLKYYKSLNLTSFEKKLFNKIYKVKRNSAKNIFKKNINIKYNQSNYTKNLLIIHDTSLIFRRYHPRNLMHVIHDDLLPLYHTSHLYKPKNTENIRLIISDPRFISPYENLYQMLSNKPLVYLSRIKKLNKNIDLVCFKKAIVGISKWTTWYHYGFRTPQGPLKNIKVTSKEVRNFTTFLFNRWKKNKFFLMIIHNKFSISSINNNFNSLGTQKNQLVKFKYANSYGNSHINKYISQIDKKSINKIFSSKFNNITSNKQKEYSLVNKINKLEEKSCLNLSCNNNLNFNYGVLIVRKSNRLILNELELILTLSRVTGMKIITLSEEDNNLQEIAFKISKAKLLVGMHGGLLIFSIFLKPNSILLELFPFAVNPINYTPYRTLATLKGMDIIYLSWRNMKRKYTLVHPERNANLGGLNHLSNEEKKQIDNSHEVGIHLCCDNPEWLFRAYQDTWVDVIEISNIIKPFFYKNNETFNSYKTFKRTESIVTNRLLFFDRNYYSTTFDFRNISSNHYFSNNKNNISAKIMQRQFTQNIDSINLTDNYESILYPSEISQITCSKIKLKSHYTPNLLQDKENKIKSINTKFNKKKSLKLKYNDKHTNSRLISNYSLKISKSKQYINQVNTMNISKRPMINNLVSDNNFISNYYRLVYLNIKWTEPFNLKYLSYGHVDYEIWLEIYRPDLKNLSSDKKIQVFLVQGSITYVLLLSVLDKLDFLVWIRCILNGNIIGPFNSLIVRCNTN